MYIVNIFPSISRCQVQVWNYPMIFLFASKKLLRKFKCINVNVCLGCFGADTQKLVSLLEPASVEVGSPRIICIYLYSWRQLSTYIDKCTYLPLVNIYIKYLLDFEYVYIYTHILVNRKYVFCGQFYPVSFVYMSLASEHTYIHTLRYVTLHYTLHCIAYIHYMHCIQCIHYIHCIHCKHYIHRNIDLHRHT